MRTAILVHIMGGGLGIISGFLVLLAAKGSAMHRRIGIVFVVAMLVMALTGATIAALTGSHTSVIMGLFTAYLVFTSFLTIRPAVAGRRWLEVGGMLLAFALGLALLRLGIMSFIGSTGSEMPAPMALIFGTVAMLSGVSDFRVMRSGHPTGSRRLRRHLWRMCFALFIASASFFLGQTGRLPEMLRSPALLAVPVLVPLVALSYWLWHLRTKRPAVGERLRQFV